VGAETGSPVDISIIIPTLSGGSLLECCLHSIFSQELKQSFEVICVDSGSSPGDLERMRRFPVRIKEIGESEFNHGLTRDLGAQMSKAAILVFLNQDAIPGDGRWLAGITEPLLSGDQSLAAVQGGIREFPGPEGRFFWDSCGERFYFTRESRHWISTYGEIGLSTINAALRRCVWAHHPFCWAPIMEDKKWQKEVVAQGYRITARHDAFVFHTHNYGFRSLIRRCESEGYGWRTLGENYSLGSMLGDLIVPRVYAELIRGLFRGRIHSAAELFFPWLRPLFLFRGNHWGRAVRHPPRSTSEAETETEPRHARNSS